MVKELRKKIASSSRWLHIYLSMVSFFILLFFAVTGLTLNHTEWFADQQVTKTFNGNLNTSWVKGKDSATIAKLDIVEFVRKQHSIVGAVSEFTTDEYQCAISFSGPGYSADVFVNREDGRYEISETTTGLFGIINDLHKGRDSGKAWKLLIDISAILMTIVSLSGLVMLFFLKKKRVAGILLMLIGTLVSLLVYMIWVP
jgi:hypothetical protein